jgi:hypothetical protein
MDAGAVSEFLAARIHLANGGLESENRSLTPGNLGSKNSRLPVATRPPQPKALPLLDDAHGIACVVAPCIWPRGARNADPHPFSAACR